MSELHFTDKNLTNKWQLPEIPGKMLLVSISKMTGMIVILYRRRISALEDASVGSLIPMKVL
jgi:hypothetical protein